MTRGRTTTLCVVLSPTERATLQAWQRRTTLPLGMVRRARILLLMERGLSVSTVALTVGSSRRFVYKWVQRFQTQGLHGLYDRPTGAAAYRTWPPPRRTPSAPKRERLGL